MSRFLVLGALAAIVVAGFRVAAAQCRQDPGRRPWFITASIVILCLAGLLVPWVLAKLDPPWSESPSGILVYLGKALVVGVPGLLALGALLGAILPGRSGSLDDT